MKNLLAIIFALTSLALVAGVSAETVYQWKNEDGVTQFGSRPPAGQDYRELRTRTGHSEPVDYNARYGQDPDPEQNPRQGETPAPQGPSEQELDQACQSALANLEVLERGGRITTEDDNGERRYLDREEIEERTEQARQMRDRAC